MTLNRRLGAVLCMLVLASACGEPTPEVTTASTAFNADTYATYRDQILPSEAESAWQQIEWYPSYAEGLREASKQQKPVLLWVMNGHPLGCT